MRSPKSNIKRDSGYNRYLLGLLLVLLAFNFADRWALGLVLQEIKVDLDLSDTQLGFLSGIAFALFYAIMGIPIARWADRGNRVTIISLTAALWSIAVALCGMAGGFAQLLLIRVGVAVGEAGGFVPGVSLLGDYFGRAERPRALAIYALGGPLSCVIGYWWAGWVNELYGWRMMFILLGAPGLILAVVARLTLREPRRKRTASLTMEAPADSAARTPSLREVSVTLWENVTFRNLLMAIAVMAFFIYGIFQWLPTFYIRSYGLAGAQIGGWFALITGLGGALGTYMGGAWASRYAAGNERLQLKVAASAIGICSILLAGMFLSPSYPIAFALMGGVIFMQTAVNGPLYATIQTLVPERMRAVSIAVVLLFANLIGMGLGPLATGALSDVLSRSAGEDSLRDALLLLTPGYFWAAWHAWRASETVVHDLSIVSTGVAGVVADIPGDHAESVMHS